MALAALHGLIPTIPNYMVAAPAWLAAALLWRSANRRTHTQVLVLSALGAITLVGSLLRGGSFDLNLTFGGNALLLAMLGAVTFLRLVTHAEPASDYTLPTGRRTFWNTLLGVHLFGAVINLSVVFIMGDRFLRQGPLQPQQVITLTRGFSAAAFWSPFFAAMAAALTYSPGADITTLLFLGAPLALLGLAITGLGCNRTDALRFSGYPMRFNTLWLPATLAVVILALHHLFPRWSVLTIICLMAPTIAIIHAWIWSPTPLKRLTDHVSGGLPGMINELLLFLGAGILAAGFASLLDTYDGWLPFDRFGGVAAATSLLFMYTVSMAGVHPVIAIAVLGNLFVPLDPDPNLLAMTFLSAWATSVGTSPFSGMNLALQGRYNIKPLDFLRWNGVYSMVMVIAACAVLLAYGGRF